MLKVSSTCGSFEALQVHVEDLPSGSALRKQGEVAHHCRIRVRSAGQTSPWASTHWSAVGGREIADTQTLDVSIGPVMVMTRPPGPGGVSQLVGASPRLHD